ncbi:hypothetical protein FIBSPDRAFT_879853 [Athelia psychrophila]|uniref:Uncharacterized protein n=1 Tax=Athelia psychrophila TaxID=1759441 RepID=A0A167TIL7_9AGAM|nr:hypothetical protein FIBSPDRAFT_879853 [Fibularhizoctonia sp. CBS 109695]
MESNRIAPSAHPTFQQVHYPHYLCFFFSDESHSRRSVQTVACNAPSAGGSASNRACPVIRPSRARRRDVLASQRIRDFHPACLQRTLR